VAEAQELGISKASSQLHTQVGAFALLAGSAGCCGPASRCPDAPLPAWLLPPPLRAPAGACAPRRLGRQCRLCGTHQVCHSRGQGSAGGRHAAVDGQQLPGLCSGRRAAQVGAARGRRYMPALWLLPATYRLPSGCRLPPADCRLPSAACRHHLPHFHCKLPPVATLHCFWTAPTAALAQVPGVGQRAGADGGQPGGAPPGQRNTHAHRCSHCGSAGAHPYHQGGHLLSQAQRHEPVQVRQLWVLRLDRSMASAVCSCRARSGL
jgi:hypothetical protein